MHETIAVPLYASLEQAAPAVGLETATATDAAAEQEGPVIQPASAAAPFMSIKDAVQNCRRAYNQTLTAEKGRGASDAKAADRATEAYCKALPYLTSEGNIRAFIACVTHAMALKIIYFDHGLKLISAARAASAALPRASRSSGRPKSNYSVP